MAAKAANFPLKKEIPPPPPDACILKSPTTIYTLRWPLQCFRGERYIAFRPYWPVWHAERGDTYNCMSTFSLGAAMACRNCADGVLSLSTRTSRTTLRWLRCVSLLHFTRRAVGCNWVLPETWPWYLSSSATR